MLHLLVCRPANATINVNISEVGGNVLETMSGSLDLTGLSDAGDFFLITGIEPDFAYVATGPYGSDVEGYTGLTGPSNFGAGGLADASTSLGDPFALNGSGYGIPYVFVPLGYVSGSLLSGNATWSGQSFASLGLTPGQYVYGGAQLDSVIINIGGVGGVPEPATWATMLLGFAAVGFVLRRKQKPHSNRQLA